MASRKAWLAEQGIGDLSWTSEASLAVHHWDDATGEFQAHLDIRVSAAVLRRRRSETDWDTRNNWPHEYRWSDDEWDWYIGSSAELRADELSALRSQLGSPPHGS